ncbi:hypothetical protein F7644_12300 [Tenacibaculum finnmarkense genomovar ulcerans]|uniref:hypothetical protein n=1 Tax=Tenacibaculum finnmarkense TaxID=2781243 RepID=UPI00187B8D75|nr:hypothetical protein [Tenacibaculum finnmarkense]MBE7646761.1 hypothetical protein [Tenacibaculum finnmarkense genomovar ulcerans]
MNTKIKNKEDLKQTLLNVRKSHRLIKEYQERMLNLVFYIKEQFMMSQIRGERRFCASLSTYKSGYGKLKVWKEMWGWDFLYSYEFEYYFGIDSTRINGKEFSLSIFQISDTGHYKGKNIDGANIKEFASSEDSESLLMFVFEIKKTEESWLWENEFENCKKKLLIESSETYQIKDNFFAITYNLEDFLNQDTVDNKLKDFSSRIESFCGLNILKKK